MTPERYKQSDVFFSQIESNVTASDSLEKIVEIDHSRQGFDAGSIMPPARVLIFSNPKLEAALVQQKQLVAIDLPLRALAFESTPGGSSKVVYNSYAFLESRYQLKPNRALEDAYKESFATALRSLESDQITHFEQESMQPDGITTIHSPFDFQTTLQKVEAAINFQDDTVNFGKVDFQARAHAVGVEIRPTTLILFGGPGPGAKAMSSAPTLGLDAFCQKFLIWQDEDQRVNLSFNNLLAMAERQKVNKSLALRIINSRLEKTFEDALSD